MLNNFMRKPKQNPNDSNGLHWNVNKWIKDENFVSFRRQMSTDMMVGLKNGVSEKEIEAVFEQFVQEFRSNMSGMWIRK